jgi:hypothetical protein
LKAIPEQQLLVQLFFDNLILNQEYFFGSFCPPAAPPPPGKADPVEFVNWTAARSSERALARV